MTQQERFDWVDRAKAYGIFLVVLGHVLEGIYLHTKSPHVFPLYKAIYSFHMPLFFVLSGFVYRHKQETFALFFSQRIFSRFIPILFFCFLALPFVFAYDKVIQGTMPIKTYVTSLILMFSGRPMLNMVMWYVVCLFTIEVFRFVLFHQLKVPQRWSVLLCLTVFCYGAGFAINWAIMARPAAVEQLLGLKKNFWYVHEAVLAFSFYLVGMLIRKSEHIWYQHKLYKGLGLLVGAIALYQTYDLNQGPFNELNLPAVSMGNGSHGHPLWFLVAALAGILVVMSFSRININSRLISYTGRNTLIILGLNGCTFQWISWLAQQGYVALPLNNVWTASLYSFGVAVAVMLAYLPGVWLLNRSVPWAIGGWRPKKPTPLPWGLRSLGNWSTREQEKAYVLQPLD